MADTVKLFCRIFSVSQSTFRLVLQKMTACTGRRARRLHPPLERGVTKGAPLGEVDHVSWRWELAVALLRGERVATHPNRLVDLGSTLESAPQKRLQQFCRRSACREAMHACAAEPERGARLGDGEGVVEIAQGVELPLLPLHRHEELLDALQARAAGPASQPTSLQHIALNEKVSKLRAQMHTGGQHPACDHSYQTIVSQITTSPG